MAKKIKTILQEFRKLIQISKYGCIFLLENMIVGSGFLDFYRMVLKNYQL
jgi:hypothetical protein